MPSQSPRVPRWLTGHVAPPLAFSLPHDEGIIDQLEYVLSIPTPVTPRICE